MKHSSKVITQVPKQTDVLQRSSSMVLEDSKRYCLMLLTDTVKEPLTLGLVTRLGKYLD